MSPCVQYNYRSPLNQTVSYLKLAFFFSHYKFSFLSQLFSSQRESAKQQEQWRNWNLHLCYLFPFSASSFQYPPPRLHPSWTTRGSADRTSRRCMPRSWSGSWICSLKRRLTLLLKARLLRHPRGRNWSRSGSSSRIWRCLVVFPLRIWVTMLAITSSLTLMMPGEV